MTRRIAIDFGTARTKVAYVPAKGQTPELLRFVSEDGLERSFLPSLFYLSKDGGPPLVGDEAEARLQEDPAGVVDDLKRRLLVPKCRANGRSETPQALLTHLFAYIGDIANGIPGTDLSETREVVLTVPPGFGPAQRDLVKATAKEAGFDIAAEPVDEPVAAALGWLAEAGEEVSRLIVLDCGGGTVDWTYLRRNEDGELRIVPACPPGGIERLGGHDVDDGLVDLVEQKLSEQNVESTEFGLARRPRLRARMRRLKETAARSKGVTEIRIGDAAVSIDRHEVEAVIHGQFVVRAVDGLRGYLAQVRKAEVDDALPPVLLVGGSARLPGLKAAVEGLGCKVVAWDRADFAVALGALQTDRPEETAAASSASAQPKRIWKSTKTASNILSGHTGAVYYAGFSPDGQRVITPSNDKTARIWDANTGTCIAILSGHTDGVGPASSSPD